EFAPSEVKFSVQRTLPEGAAALEPAQKTFLRLLGERLSPSMGGEEIHALVYDLAKAAGLPKATPAFEAIYRVFLAQPKGPRGGWFLAFLDGEFVRGRLKQAAAA